MPTGYPQHYFFFNLASISIRKSIPDQILGGPLHVHVGPDKQYICNLECKIIRIYHEYEGGIEKSVPSITVWHQEACWVMSKDKQWFQGTDWFIYTNNKLFFLLTIEIYSKMNCQKFLNMLRCNITWWRHWLNNESFDYHLPEFQYNQCTALQWEPGLDNMGQMRFSIPGYTSEICILCA